MNLARQFAQAVIDECVDRVGAGNHGQHLIDCDLASDVDDLLSAVMEEVDSPCWWWPGVLDVFFRAGVVAAYLDESGVCHVDANTGGSCVADSPSFDQLMRAVDEVLKRDAVRWPIRAKRVVQS